MARIFLRPCSRIFHWDSSSASCPHCAATRRDLLPALKDERQLAGPRRSRLRSSLVVAQITVCLVLLISAGLCVRSLFNARSIDPGFSTHDIAVAQLDPGSLGYTEAQDRRVLSPAS